MNILSLNKKTDLEKFEKNICAVETKWVDWFEIKFLNSEEIKNLKREGWIKIINIEEKLQADFTSFERVIDIYLPALEADTIHSVAEAIQDEEIILYTKKLILAYWVNRYFDRMNEKFFEKKLWIKKEFFININKSKLNSPSKYSLIEIFKEINQDIKSLKGKLVQTILKIWTFLWISFWVISIFLFKVLPAATGMMNVWTVDVNSIESIQRINTVLPIILYATGTIFWIFVLISLFAFIFPKNFVEILKNYNRGGFAVVKNFNSLKLISYYLIWISEIQRDKLAEYFDKEFYFLNINKSGWILFSNIFKVVEDVKRDLNYKVWFDSSVLINLKMVSARNFDEQKNLLMKQKKWLKTLLEENIKRIFLKLDIFSKAVLIVAILSSFSAYAMIAGAVTELMKKI